MKNRFLSVLLSVVLLCTLSPTAFADSRNETDDAIAYLVEHNIYQGDESGNLMLESGLTRAQLATVLTRINGMDHEVTSSEAEYSIMCYFVDVPMWARPYVGYCADKQLMVGYDLFTFGPNDPVTPAMVCTVLLRHLGYAETDWSFETACMKALEIGLANDKVVAGVTISRSNTAVLLYRALTGSFENIAPPDPKPQQEDLSAHASDAVFNPVLTREAYNAIRQTIIDRAVILAGNASGDVNPSYPYREALATENTITAMREVLAAIGSYPSYFMKTDLCSDANQPYSFICGVRFSDGYRQAADYTDSFISQISTMSELEKIREITWYVCDRLTYDSGSIPTPRTVLTSDDVQAGNCMAYAHSFLFLCERANLPCMLICSTTHQWNLVFIDGRWWHVDLTGEDVGDETGSRSYADILYDASDMQGAMYVDAFPHITAFAQELLIPGSSQ